MTSTAILRASGVHPRIIAQALEDELIYRAGVALIVTPEVYADPRLDDAVACTHTGGVIARMTAGHRHGLVEAMPDQIEMIVPATKARIPADLNVRAWRSRNPNSFTAGVQVFDVHGLELRMTNPERTVVDLWRDRTGHIGDHQHRLTALRAYLSNHDAGPLQEMADVFRIRHRLDTAIEVSIESLKGPML